jgi:hypothetical protein
MNVKEIQGMDKDQCLVCAGCNGHRWTIVLVDREDGRAPVITVKSCPLCNPEGKEPIGVTIKDPVGTNWFKNYPRCTHCGGTGIEPKNPTYTPAQVAKHIQRTGDRVVLGEEER